MGDTASASAWDADAATYDAWFDRPWGAYASTIEHRLLIDSAPRLGGLRMCDAGCGTGRFAARLESEGAIVTAVDADPDALGIARTRMRGPVACADIDHLPFPDDTFDVVFAVTVCEFTADTAATIAELARVTRPGGHVIVGSLNPDSPWGRWNRRQFDQPPWSTARFLDHDRLDRIGREHGTTSWRRGLYAPGALPGLTRWGSILERVGRRIAPRHAAFEVVTITLPRPAPASTRMT